MARIQRELDDVIGASPGPLGGSGPQQCCCEPPLVGLADQGSPLVEENLVDRDRLPTGEVAVNPALPPLLTGTEGQDGFFGEDRDRDR